MLYDIDFGYTGKLFDITTGLQNNLNRWYDSSVGKWISEDPIGFAAGDANLSRYVGNAVTMFVDPNGLQGHPGGKPLPRPKPADNPFEAPSFGELYFDFFLPGSGPDQIDWLDTGISTIKCTGWGMIVVGGGGAAGITVGGGGSAGAGGAAAYKTGKYLRRLERCVEQGSMFP